MHAQCHASDNEVFIVASNRPLRLFCIKQPARFRGSQLRDRAVEELRDRRR